ncbi:MAG TPA: hypothetical protein VMX17_17020 [Candidatus Glassbacteria bacterium]|nr:hypothetical protein [Candidatus Glassbacteria bacterium]
METSKKLKRVWVVLGGEQRYDEGGDVVGVFRKKKKAIKKALAQETYSAGGWTQIDDCYWTNGCDFIEILRYEVE